MDRKIVKKTETFIQLKDLQNGGVRLPCWCINPKDGEVYFSSGNVLGWGRLTNHSIEPNGEVNASVLVRGVDKDGKVAEYHEMVILEDWDPKTFKKAGNATVEKVI